MCSRTDSHGGSAGPHFAVATTARPSQSRIFRVAWIFLLATLVYPAFGEDPATLDEFFESRIRPLLARKCFACHEATAMGELQMASRASLLRGGASGPAVVPGKPAESLLIQVVNHTHKRLAMPFGEKKLSQEEIADLVEWVKAGAVWPEHSSERRAPKHSEPVITEEQRAFWAFQAIRRPSLPAVKNEPWVKSPIDRFVLTKLDAKGLRPNAAADKRTLIRRAYFDLIGLPPTAKEIENFLNDSSEQAFARVVDGLLASPRYGERWGRYWLDVARYSDDRYHTGMDDPYENAFRYRDWVIQAFNEDMPYDVFVKAQIAGDLLEHPQYKDLAMGLGFYGLSPEQQDDRVDATTRGFLALTVACAQCHDHKFDPIPTRDYYALLGVFKSTERAEYVLAADALVEEYQKQKKKIDELKLRIRDLLNAQATQLSEIVAYQSPEYLRAARQVLGPEKKDVRAVAQQQDLDEETLQRWVTYLNEPHKDHPYLDNWRDEANFDLKQFRDRVLDVLKERKKVDEANLVNKAVAKRKVPKVRPEAVPLDPTSYFLWRDLFFSDFYGSQFKREEDGILYYGPNRGYFESDGTIERFCDGRLKKHLEKLRADIARLESALPPPYPFAHVIKDVEEPKNERVRIGGVKDNLGEEVPRGFLTILCDGEPKSFENGSGRLELAEAIASPTNPLTARVMVNRIWQHHFGVGIVGTPSNFGSMGERPTHPELLDYLAARFIEKDWSMKELNREIMLSATYALSSDSFEKNLSIDPDNRLLWRANLRRLDAETLRDSLLYVTGELDPTSGGPPEMLTASDNHRRTVYGFVSRRKLDNSLALFDFPNPNITAGHRLVTANPLQQLFFLNSDFMATRAEILSAKLAAAPRADEQARLHTAYKMVLGRAPSQKEFQLGLEFLEDGANDWSHLAKVLLSSNEFLFVN